jgi:acetamidase/formamidase
VATKIFLTAMLGLFATMAHAGPMSPTDAGGAWQMTARFHSGGAAGAMTLAVEAGAITGSSGALDEAGLFPLTIKGALKDGRAQLQFLYRDQVVGEGRFDLAQGRLIGQGTLYGAPATFEAARAPARPAAARTHDFKPSRYQVAYGPDAAPVLTIAPGDTIRTSTLDNQGRDHALQWRGMPGNTLTGPFFVEGAMPGDTLVVHLLKVELNRDSADMYGARLNGKAVQPSPAQTPTKGWGTRWRLDSAKGVARPPDPSERLANLTVALKPMVGSIGVAPPGGQTLAAGDLGFHGGNLDYPRLTSGATVYFPVFRQGALLSLGDGHALQGDGEITGQGLETSLDVEFRVELIHGQNLGQVWSEDADAVMVSGIDNTLDTALQMATSGLARWLKSRYGLDDSEVATLLGATVTYEIAEVVDPRPHVVARIAKSTLAMLKTP